MRLNSDQRRDVEALLIPIIQDAHRQADAVGAFLDALGVLPPKKNGKRPRVYLSADLLHKVAALVYIHQWKQARWRPCLPAELPPSRAILEDTLGVPPRRKPRYSGHQLARSVLHTHLSRMAWTRLPAAQSDVAVASRVPSDQTLSAVADFLWEFRHLAK
ncbi:MAG: hypothetical protein JNM56_09300 [Planctomycetia bacterium]|nr:hypothetical protein [Planctomycetia bacterium]